MVGRSLRIAWSIGLCLLLTASIASFDPHAELRAIVSGDMKGVIHRLNAELSDPAIRRDTLLHARTLEMLGEQYYRISDIDEAKRYWDEALELRRARFGNDSPEAGAGLAYQARYHNYMAAPQWDHQITAEETSVRAIELIANAGDVLPFERVVALRERAYAYKVFHGLYAIQRTKDSPAEPSVAARPYFRKALQEAIAARDTIWTAQILHDIGNTFTDQAIPSRGDPAKLHMVVDSAMWYYDRSITLMQAHGLGTSEPVMMDHLTIGLLQEYAFQKGGYMPAIQSYRRALRVLLDMQRIPRTTDLYRFQPSVPNKAQVLELMSFISHCYDRIWWEDKQSSYIDSAIHVIEAAVPYWEALVKEYGSRRLHLVTSSYAHSPFQYAHIFHMDRYVHKGNSDDLIAAMIHLERRRNLKIQRDRLKRGLPSLQFLEEPVTLDDLVAPQGTLIIEYMSGHGFSAVVIDEHGPRSIELGPTPFNPEFGVGRFAEFAVNEVSADRQEFRRKAVEWYQRLLQPLLQGRTERKLVIIPYGTLSHLPFAALMIDTVPDRYVGQEYEIRIAPDLRSALQPMQLAEDRTMITVANGAETSDLPFALRYARALAQDFDSGLDTALRSDRLDLLLREPGILHIASHARAAGLPDTEPYILLTDRAWSEKDIPWGKVDRDLIVLAACSSGSGRVFLGEGAQSLGHALLQAGADAVIHTLWPVDDRSTNEILHHMYTSMLAGDPASTALHKAKNRFMEEHEDDGLDDPFYWSGIILVGTDVRLDRDRPGVLIGSVVAALLLIGILVHKRSSSSRERPLN